MVETVKSQGTFILHYLTFFNLPRPATATATTAATTTTATA